MLRPKNRSSTDWIITPDKTINANPVARKRCTDEGVSDAPIKLRLIRVDLPSGIEVLVTNILEKTACLTACLNHFITFAGE